MLLYAKPSVSHGHILLYIFLFTIIFIFSVVGFHPDAEKLQLFSAAKDYKVRVWDLSSSTCIAEIEAHFSVVTSLCFSVDGKALYR